MPERDDGGLRGPRCGRRGLGKQAALFTASTALSGRTVDDAAFVFAFAGRVEHAGRIQVYSSSGRGQGKGVDSDAVVNEKSRLLAGFSLKLVPRRGLEPPRLAALVPETSASTNSAIWAGRRIIANGFGLAKPFFASRLELGGGDEGPCGGAAGVISAGMDATSGVRIRRHNERDHAAIAGEKDADKKSRSEERLSRETGAQKRTRTSTPCSAST